MIEDWQIWCRWKKAFDRGETSNETHPALPADKMRHQELERALVGMFEVPEDAPAFKAEFRGHLMTGPAEVQWSRLPVSPGTAR